MRDPPGGDERISAYAAALGDAIDHGAPISDFVNEMLTIEPNIGSSYLVTKILRALQSQLYRHFPGYPQTFLTPWQWHEGFNWVLDDPYRAGQLYVDVLARPLQSNESQRYKALRAFGTVAQQLGHLSVFSIMDVGCSQNAGLNHLASGVGFEPPLVVEGRRHTNAQLTAAFSATLKRPLGLAPSVGIDIVPPDDARAWAWACSHYPSELLDTARIALFEALIDASYDAVSFYQGNFAHFDTAGFDQAYANKRYGIVNFSTVLYQVNEQERQQMLATAEQYATDFITVQDFISIDPNDPTRLIFRNNWQSEHHPYRFVVRDMQDKTKRWHELFRWRDGRCRELSFGLGRIAVENRKSSSIRTALKKVSQQYESAYL